MHLNVQQSATKRVAIVLDKYPSVSESFVQRELVSLISFGFTLAIFACDSASHSDMRLAPELRLSVFRPTDGLKGLKNRVCANGESILNMSQACNLFSGGPRGIASAYRAAWTAAAIRPLLKSWKPDWVHAHFLSLPAVTACLLTKRLNLPLSISAHARDIFVPVVRLGSVCDRARFIATCSEQGQASLIGRLPVELVGRIKHFPHYVPSGLDTVVRDRHPDKPLRLLSVCRLVPKKGIEVVLHALALLQSDLHFRYRILGGGPEILHLSALVQELGLKGVEFYGPASPETVATELTQADVFVLGTCTAPDGDRDGIPNAMLEAILAMVPVVVSDGGAVSEVIKHRHTGWLPPPNDPHAFAEALREMASDDALRRRVVANAFAEVRYRFSTYRNQSRLALRLIKELETGHSSG